MTTYALSFAVNRADAESLPDLDDSLPEAPTLNVEEPDPDQPDAWRLTAYFDDEPTPETVTRITTLFASARDPVLAALPDADWTTLSQANLTPVRAGRFLVHTAAHAHAVRPGDMALEIEAGLAFGTGQHATTHGCLEALDRLARWRRFRNVADLGTGTGILAMAAARRWPTARVIATDNDPIAVAVTAANCKTNKIRRGRIALAIAAGMAHRDLAARAPYDLIVANILAGPLVAMSRDVSRAVAPGGTLILAGLLRSQSRRVLSAYRRHGLVPLRQHGRGEWPCLVLTRRRNHSA